MNINTIFITTFSILSISICIVYFVSKNNIENYNQCSLIKNNKFDSIKTVISINNKRYDFEYSIEEVQKIINKYDKNKLDTVMFLSWLNKQKDLYHDNKKFYIVKKKDNEIILYRDGKAYGFHIMLSKNKIYVMGIIMEYTIDKMLKNTKEEETLDYIQQRHIADPRFSAYV